MIKVVLSRVNGLDRISNETCAIVGNVLSIAGCRLAELCGVNGEKMIDQNELSNGSFNQKKILWFNKFGLFMRIEKGSGTYNFKCPDWVTLR